MMKIINKRFGKFREKYLPSIDLGNYEIYKFFFYSVAQLTNDLFSEFRPGAI